jgi:hypothetical protein
VTKKHQDACREQGGQRVVCLVCHPPIIDLREELLEASEEVLDGLRQGIEHCRVPQIEFIDFNQVLGPANEGRNGRGVMPQSGT